MLEMLAILAWLSLMMPWLLEILPSRVVWVSCASLSFVSRCFNLVNGEFNFQN